MPVATTALLDSPRVKQLSDGNPTGTVFGVSTTDLIGFYGTATPIAQPSGNAQAAVTRGQGGGSIITFSSVQSPSSIQAQTSSELTFSLLGATTGIPLASTDAIIINKPTAQAGLGITNARGLGVNQMGIAFANLTGTTVAPTVTEIYQVVALRGFNSITSALTPAAVAANTTAEQQFTVTGLRAGELVIVNKPTNQAGLGIVNSRVVSNNLLGITYANWTNTSITPTAAESYTIYCLGGLDTVNNEVMMQITTSPVSVAAASTTTEYLMNVSGLSLGDIAKNVYKPTVQNGIGIVNARVSVPGTIGVAFNNTGGVTVLPTTGEVYTVSLFRANPVAPLVLYTPTLNNASSVPGATTAEQTMTVTGLIAGTQVFVNMQGTQSGLGIVNARVSASNTLAITFSNTNAASVTPANGTSFIVGNFQDPPITGGLMTIANGTALIKSAVGVIQQSAVLANAERSALVNNGLIAGA